MLNLLTFPVLSTILATSTAQGLTRGHRYRVVGALTKQTPFGLFVTYEVVDAASVCHPNGAEAFVVGNLHLLAALVDEAAPDLINFDARWWRGVPADAPAKRGKGVASHLTRDDVVDIVARCIEGTRQYVATECKEAIDALMECDNITACLCVHLPHNDGEERLAMVRALRPVRVATRRAR